MIVIIAWQVKSAIDETVNGYKTPDRRLSFSKKYKIYAELSTDGNWGLSASADRVIEFWNLDLGIWI